MRIKARIFSTLTAVTMATAGAIAIAPASDAAIISGRCAYTSSQPTLSYGSSGTAVQQAQCEINYSVLGAGLAVDGSFGPNTLAAVKKFQGCAHLVVDGIVGPNTWSALNYWAASSGWAC